MFRILISFQQFALFLLVVFLSCWLLPFEH